MNRHKALFFASIAAVLLILPACEQAGPRQPEDPVSKTNDTRKSDHGGNEDVKIETVPVAGNIYMLIGRGGNIGVSVGDDGILIIDDQFAPLADKIRAAVGELSKGKLEYVLNTHYHGDHTGGNPVFGKDATIIAHDNVRNSLITNGMEAQGLPVITFDKTLTVHFNGETIRAVHFARGHTSGDSIIFFEKSNVIHMGDHFFKDRFPFVDVKGGGNALGYEENVREVLGMIKPDTKIIPGHGSLATREELARFHGMLTETIGIVRDHKSQGKTVAQIQKAGLPAKWKTWGEGFINTDKWISTIYESLP